MWAYPSCLVPLSYKLHAELAAEHDGAQKWGYRKLNCGSFEAVVSSKRIEQMQKSKGDGKAWEKLPKQNDAAKELLEASTLPKDLDWIDRDVVTGYAEMGRPGATETAQVHPYHFTTTIAALAQSGGVDIKTKAQVTKIKSSATGVESLEYLDRNTNETKEIKDVTDIMVAAGPWTGRVLPRAKVEGLRAHSVVYEADVSPYAVFTDIELPTNFTPEHRVKMGQKRKHKGSVDPEIYARPFGEVYACGEYQRHIADHTGGLTALQVSRIQRYRFQTPQTLSSLMRPSATTSSRTSVPSARSSAPRPSRRSRHATYPGTCGSARRADHSSGGLRCLACG